MTGPLARLGAGWRRFWFEPQETSTLGLLRIAYGVVATGWTVSLAPNLFAFFGPNGIEPGRPESNPGEWGVLPAPASPAVIIAFFAVLLSGTIALTLGLFTRVAAIVVFVGIVSIEHANMLVGNSGDGLIRNLAFYLMLAPSGAALSLDRLRKARDRFWEFPARAPWALRLVQIQLSVGYLSAVWHKVQSALWREGTAVSYALRVEDIHRFHTPGLIAQSVKLTELLTFGTMALELSLAVLVWNRAARPWVLALGVSMHLAIDYSILIGFFSLAMFVTYLSFIPPDTASRYVLAARDRVGRWRSGQRRRGWRSERRRGWRGGRRSERPSSPAGAAGSQTPVG
ncbi:MAG: HTTM domain-containing protein [Pseudonocardia sp.]